MPRLNLAYLDLDELPSFEPTRRDQSPVSGKHDLQRRAENGINRFRRNLAKDEYRDK